MKLIAASDLKPATTKKVESIADTCPPAVVWLKHPLGEYIVVRYFLWTLTESFMWDVELKKEQMVVSPYIASSPDISSSPNISLSSDIPSSTLDDELPVSSDDIFVHNLVFISVMAVYVFIMLVVFGKLVN